MFSFEIGLIAVLVVSFVVQLNPNKNWVSEKINLSAYKTLIALAFVSSIYLILAGINLLTENYFEEFTKPALEKMSSEPESLKAVKNPKKGIALALVLVLPWFLIIFGGFGAFLYRSYWKRLSQDKQ